MLTLPPELRGFIKSRNLPDMKARIIEGDQAYAFGAHNLLTDHLDMLQREFCGRTEIEFYHAAIIVLIRRKMDLEDSTARYFDLWRCEPSFLIENLDSRWLVSACDTFMDHAPEPEERALALAGVLFANTIKLYETEYRALGLAEERGSYVRMPNARVALHDGMTGFMIGNGDMIANMYKRANSVCSNGSTAARIVQELMARARSHDTVLGRFRRVHRNANTVW